MRSSDARFASRLRAENALGDPEVTELREEAGHAALREEWLELAGRVAETSYFQTPDWVIGWWATVGGRPPTIIATWRDASGRLDALIAMSRIRRRLEPRLPLKVSLVTPAGSGPPGDADHCGWPVLPHRAPEVRAWISSILATGALLENLDPGTGMPLVPRGARRLAVHDCPRLVPAEDPGRIGRSAGFRAQIRRYRRQLASEGVSIRVVPPGGMPSHLLDTLFALHDERYREKGQRSGWRRGEDDRAFHLRLVAAATKDRGPAAVVAERHGDVVGVLYGFWWMKTFSYYQSGWRPSLGALGLGTVMIAEAIRWSASMGAEVFDFLRGREPYKYRFADSERTDETWLVPRGFSGRAFDMRYRAVGTIKAAARIGRS